MVQRTDLILAMALLAAVSGGCGDGLDPLSDGGSGGDGVADGKLVPGRTDAVSQEMTESASCDRYLSCLAVALPAAFPVALQVYQQSGPCWDTPATASNCEKACDKGYEQLKTAHRTVPECGGCDPSTDANCKTLKSGTYRCLVLETEPGCGIERMIRQDFEVLVKADSDGMGDFGMDFFDPYVFSSGSVRRTGAFFKGEADLGDNYGRSCDSGPGTVSVKALFSGEIVAPNAFDLTLSAEIKGTGACVSAGCRGSVRSHCTL